METKQLSDFIINANTGKQIAEDAKQGDAAAQFIVGGCYYFGKGVAKNRVKAVKWYRKAMGTRFSAGSTSSWWLLFLWQWYCERFMSRL